MKLLRLLLIALILNVPGTTVMAAPGDFEAWVAGQRGQQRLVLVYSPTPDDPRFERQHRIFEAHAGQMRERGISTAEIVWDGEVAINGTPRASMSPPEAYRRSVVPVEQFQVLVVGKDGQIKRRTSTTLEASDLFALIDAMPGRQQEMR